MAAEIAKNLIKSANIKNINTDSAGLCASQGEPAAFNAKLAMKEIGLDISYHTSKSIKSEEIKSIDYFFVMSSYHKEMIELAGIKSEKIIILGDGISDPYGEGIEIYRICRNQLVSAIKKALKEVGIIE
jgi:Protein-tyrosine-phosphatase